MKKNVDAGDAPCARDMQPKAVDWAQRFQAVTQTALQAQLVHCEGRPLWVNAAFVDVFRFESVAEALSCPRLLDLLTDDLARGGGDYGRRILRRRDGARFAADVYSKRVLWDGLCAAAVSILDASDEESALRDLAAGRGGAWLCASAPQRACACRPPRRAPIDVLLVNADRAARRDEAALLYALGCRPTLAGGAAEAIQALTARSFELVLLALDLPRMNGFELARRIRALPPPWAELPIAALAPRLSEDVREAAAEAGMDACIAAPVTQTRLAAAIAALTRSIRPAELDEIEQEDDRDEPGDRIDGEHAFSALI